MRMVLASISHGPVARARVSLLPRVRFDPPRNASTMRFDAVGLPGRRGPATALALGPAFEYAHWLFHITVRERPSATAPDQS